MRQRLPLLQPRLRYPRCLHQRLLPLVAAAAALPLAAVSLAAWLLHTAAAAAADF
jgi:hypothetical protein